MAARLLLRLRDRPRGHRIDLLLGRLLHRLFGPRLDRRCQAAHVGYVISGRMKVVMDDGTADEFGPGDLMICPAGHDAWIVGDEPCVVIDWAGFADYAKR